MLEFFYESWGWITAISAIVPLLSLAIPYFWKKDHQELKDQKTNCILSNIGTALITTWFWFSFLCLLTYLMHVKVPVLRDKTVGAAIQELHYSGLEVSLPNGNLLTDEIMDKSVIGQKEEPGTLVLKGSHITPYYSNNGLYNIPDYIEVPSVVGKSYTEAIRILSECHLQYQFDVTDEPSTSAYITFQSYLPGTMVQQGTIITLQYVDNTGVIDSPVPDGYVVVPNVVDYEENSAVEILEQQGFEVSVWYLSSLSESFETYYIVEQSIPEGSIVPRGTKIELQKSGVKNGTSIVVPNVEGMEQEEATALLVNKGLSFQVWWTEEVNDLPNAMYVVHQSIPEGSMVLAGTVVRLQLGEKNNR